MQLTLGVRTFPKQSAELAEVYGTIDTTFQSLNPCVADDATDVPVGAVQFEETEEALLQRCATTLTRIIEQHPNGESFAIVSHAPCDQALALHLEGKGVSESKLLPWPLGGITVFSRKMIADGSFSEWELEFYGNTEHMPGKWKDGIKEWSLPCLAGGVKS
jgi:broad specificity phosphatase PhoE